MLYTLIVLVIAIAIVNKSKLRNVNLLWILPVVYIGLWILGIIAGAFFKWIVLPVIVVGLAVTASLYLLKKV
jgi:hypothetical protein